MSSTTISRPARTPLALKDVRIADAFWSARQELIRTQTLRQQEQMLYKTGQFAALELTWRPGDENEPHIFWESDVAKWIEAASYCLAVHDDPELDAAVDRAVDLLAGAQQSDGYLNVYFTVVKPGERFTDLRDAHELYCAGHLIEAGVAHHEATGKTTLLDIVRRYANLIVETFGPGGSHEGGYDGHEEIELALVKLARATGDSRYLDLSKQMIDARGTRPFFFDREAERRGDAGYFGTVFPHRDQQAERFREYNQSHRPVREQTKIVGHSVRAMYLLSAVTDVAQEYDDQELLAASRRLWEDLVDTKLYVTGGVGADPSIEGFGPGHDLPNRHGYAETCAAIGLVQWAQRLANLTGDGAYVDTLERALYNGVLSGASDDGTHYFYGNPLASDGDVHRHEWFGVACCPPNLARLISELGHYLYSQGPEEAIVNLYASSTGTFRFAEHLITVQQETEYPLNGKVRLTVHPGATPYRFTLALRIPAWAVGAATVDGHPVQHHLTDGYLRIERVWSAGDVVELDLHLTPRRTWTSPAVGANAGTVALEHGPLVFCLEGVDHPVRTTSLVLPRDATIREDTAAGKIVLHVDGIAETSQNSPLYQNVPPTSAPALITAVPYATWGNRGQSDMTVWIRESAGGS